MAAIARTAVAGNTGVNFGDLGMYSGGQFIPDAAYIMFFNVVMHQATDKTTGATKGPNLLGVMVDFYAKDNPTEDAKLQKFFSMGSKAHLSFAPNPDTGKGIVPIANAAGTNLNDKTNWALVLKSLYDCGLPPGVFTNDVSVLDGVWAQVTNVDEPAERSTFASTTGEAAQPERKGGKIPVMTEILEGGAPWEGGGGLVEAKPTKAAPKLAPKVMPKPAARPAPVAVAATVDDEDVKTAAINGVASVLGAKPNGLPIIALRTETFKHVKANASEETAGQVISAFFDAGAAALNGFLGEMGYTTKGPMVVPA